MNIKKIVIWVLMLISLASFFTCRVNKIPTCQFGGDVFTYIKKYNDQGDTIEGYYRIDTSGEFYYISLFDVENYSKYCECNDGEKHNKPYILFSLNNTKPHGLRKNICNQISPEISDTDYIYVDYRNVIYPLEKYDSLYYCKHVAGVYDSGNFMYRTFILNQNFEIVSFTTTGKIKGNFFFYDNSLREYGDVQIYNTVKH